MNPAFPIILAGIASAGIAATANEEAVARFSNNDQLAGTLESLSADLLVWKSPVFEQPASFFLKNVVDLSLPAHMPEITADHVATLTLTNGDTVHGQLASVTDETVCLDTWFAGRMNFNRLMVSSVKVAGTSTFLYRGPSGLDGWTQSGDTPVWTYARSAFRSDDAGSIARDGLLPEECAITFEAAWKSDSIALKVILFSADPSSDSPASGYELSFQRGSAYLRRNGKSQGHLGSWHSQELRENDKVKIEIRASRKSGKVCLFINGRIAEVWTDPDVGKSEFGSCLHFVSRNALPMRISEIGVSPWDGSIDQIPEPQNRVIRRFGLQMRGGDPMPAPPESPTQPRMELANGDSLEGEVSSIEDGKILMKTPLGDISLPVARLRSVALKPVDLERCIRRNGDIRGWFADGTSMVFRLDAVDETSLTGSSQNFGNATFRMNAFSRIEFNIYDLALEDRRADDEW